MNSIEEDSFNFHNDTLKLKEAKQPISYFYYNEVNSIKEESIFGELALNNTNKKRTATIITKELSYFAILSKKVYDSYLKIAQIKSRIRKMLYFTEGPIFKGVFHGTFLNKYFFRIKKIECSKGKIIFNRDDSRNKIYFIVKGEFELSCKITLNEISDIIEKLGGISDNKKEKYLCRMYDEFKKIYTSKKINIKVCVINKNKVIGLDDMCINNKYIFDCKCISTDETELYMFDYKNFEDALKENDLIMTNNINYVNKRREIYIKLLFEQRNSLVDIEYRKIKKDYKIKKKLIATDINKKNNILNTIMKKVEYNNDDKEKAIIIVENYKNYKKLSTIYNIKNNSNNSFNNSNSHNKSKYNKIYLSPNNYVINKYKSNKNIFNNVLGKDINKTEDRKRSFYPKIMSEKKFISDKNLTNNLNIIKNNKELKKKEIKGIEEKKLTNKDNFIKQIATRLENNFSKKNIKLNIYKSQNKNYFEYNKDNTESSNLGISLNSNIINSLNPNTNYPKTIEANMRRKLIPILTKSSLNKKNKKKLGFKVPSLFKEYSKKYIIKKTKISSPDDIYLDHQEDIFNVFNKRNKEKKLLITLRTIYNGKSQNEIINNNKAKNKTAYGKFIINKRKKKVFNFNNKPKNAGIIDCLCLDNWAEKTEFEKKYFG